MYEFLTSRGFHIVGLPIIFLASSALLRFLSHPKPKLREVLQVAIQLCILNLGAHATVCIAILERLKADLSQPLRAQLTAALTETLGSVVIFVLPTLVCPVIKRFLVLKFPNIELILADLVGVLTLGLGTRNLMVIVRKYAIF